MRMRRQMRFLALAFLGLVAGLPAAAQERVGVNAAVNTDANGIPPGGTIRRLVIGQDVVHNEHITTDAKGQTQILFVDGSSVSIGPNADLVIDEFIYDPTTGTGKMTLTELQGAMRFVGGKLSKQDNAVTLHIGTSTIGVRGGVFVADVQPGGKTEVIFVYGKEVTVSGQSGGCSQQLYRPGFAVEIGKPGGCPDNPHQAPPGSTAAILSQLDGSQGKSGGATTVPTNTMVANSSLPNTISNNVTLSIQEANAAAPFVATPPTPTVTPPQVPQNQIQIASSQSQPVVANPPTPTPPTPTPSPSPSSAGGISGGIVSLDSNNPAFGFPSKVIGYSNATVNNGVLVITVGSQSGSIPLAQGTGTVNGNGTYSPVGPLSGTTYSTAGNTFFYANLAPVDDPSNKLLIYGGTPVNSSAVQATGSPQVYAYALQPDAVLQSPVPFVRNVTGGSLSNPSVSPLYVAVPANVGLNASPSSTSGLPVALQASMAVNGQGAAQSSLLTVAVGNIGANSGQPLLGGKVEGSYQANGNTPATLISSAISTAVDPTGASLYGGNQIAGFVLTPNSCCTNGSPATSLATETNTLSGQTANYNFNIPAIATALPAIASGPQAGNTLIGAAGGTMNAITNGNVTPYALSGVSVFIFNPNTLQVEAAIAGSDPFTPGTSGVNSLALLFGSAVPGLNGHQAYINDNLFAALETPGGNYSSLNNTTGTAQLYLVNANAVPGAINSILPSGVSLCACQYLQWGYWGGELTTSSGGTTRTDIGSINTWVAGVPTVNLPTTGSGSYSGAAIGTVNNAGATYLAAGGFNSSYNFGTNNGSVAINNFDSHNFSGSVSGFGGVYSGSIAGNGGNRQGTVNGFFYGPGAAETGGNFAVQATSGPSYVASGIFAGKLTGPIH
jgi:trimeric autotransporter adhesin